jgi:hypothetical protein
LLDEGVLTDDQATEFFEPGENLEVALAGPWADSVRAMAGAMERRSHSQEQRPSSCGALARGDFWNLGILDLRWPHWESVPKAAFASCSRAKSARLPGEKELQSARMCSNDAPR